MFITLKIRKKTRFDDNFTFAYRLVLKAWHHTAVHLAFAIAFFTMSIYISFVVLLG